MHSGAARLDRLCFKGELTNPRSNWTADNAGDELVEDKVRLELSGDESDVGFESRLLFDHDEATKDLLPTSTSPELNSIQSERRTLLFELLDLSF